MESSQKNVSQTTPIPAALNYSADLTKIDPKKIKKVWIKKKKEADKAEMAKIPYASAVGCLMYAIMCTRPNISHEVGVVNIFMSNPGKEQREGVKWLLRYLKGTADVTFCFKRNKVILEGFVDGDLGGGECDDFKKSTKDYVFTIGGTTISWMKDYRRVLLYQPPKQNTFL